VALASVLQGTGMGDASLHPFVLSFNIGPKQPPEHMKIKRPKNKVVAHVPTAHQVGSLSFASQLGPFLGVRFWN